MNKRLKKKKGLLIDKKELYNLDLTLAEYILPRIKKFRQMNKPSFPAELKDMEEWNKILDKMIYSFEWALKPKDLGDMDKLEKERKKYKRGMKLFVEHFDDLWI